MKFNVSQAARAIDKSRKTIYRHIEKGKLSSEKDELNNHLIDVSELQRVYGKLDMEAAQGTGGQDEDTTQSATPRAQPQMDIERHLLEQENKHLKEMLDVERERREHAEQEKVTLLEIMERQSRQLEAPKEESIATPEQSGDKQKKGFWQRLLGA